MVITDAARRAGTVSSRPGTPFLGIPMNGAAGAVDLVCALVPIRGGRAWTLPALVAGGERVMTDARTTGASLFGFALVRRTGVVAA